MMEYEDRWMKVHNWLVIDEPIMNLYPSLRYSRISRFRQVGVDVFGSSLMVQTNWKKRWSRQSFYQPSAIFLFSKHQKILQRNRFLWIGQSLSRRIGFLFFHSTIWLPLDLEHPSVTHKVCPIWVFDNLAYFIHCQRIKRIMNSFPPFFISSASFYDLAVISGFGFWAINAILELSPKYCLASASCSLFTESNRWSSFSLSLNSDRIWYIIVYFGCT